jgi:hypothetical protein
MPTQLDTSLVSITFYNRDCLCGQPVNAEDVNSYHAVSACHPDPGLAEWREDKEGSRFLCLGHVAAGNMRKFGESPGLYLIHRCCNDIIATDYGVRSLFDCFRALRPILHESPPPIQHIWPWSSFCALYAPILRNIFSKTTETKIDVMVSKSDKFLQVITIMNKHLPRELSDMVHHHLPDQLATILPCFTLKQGQFERPLKVLTAMKKHLPHELSDMILDYLPCQLAIILDHLSDGGQCLRRLRQDPIARRFELATQILGHETRIFRHPENKIKLESVMVAEFVKLGRHWCLRDLVSASRQDIGGQTQFGRVQRLNFKHCRDRSPWIAVQVSEYAITHIAFEMGADGPRWISPNAVDSKAAFFEDKGSGERFEYVFVISDVRGSHEFISV